MPRADFPEGAAWGEEETGGPGLRCPHCGEPLDAWVDPTGGAQQSYVEDCAVCCRPILFHASVDPESGETGVWVSAEI